MLPTGNGNESISVRSGDTRIMAVVLSADENIISKVKRSLPSHEGWVFDSSKLSPFSRKRARHFVQLQNGVLYVYRNPERSAKKSFVLRGAEVGRGQGRQSVMVSVKNKAHTFYCISSEDHKRWLKLLEISASWKLHDFYELGAVIGNEHTSKVLMCTQIATGVDLALKTVKKTDRPADLVYNEMAIISQPLHLNIIHAVDILETSENMYLIQEYMAGGSLYDFIKKNCRFSESQARNAMRLLLSGVKALHDSGIVHRDLKPENILCKNETWPLIIKIADFGLAGFLEKSGKLKTASHFIGTVGYAAPEQFDGRNCGKAIDIWACGVILFNMLSATMPFGGVMRDEIIWRTKNSDYSFPSDWDDVTEDAKSFIRSCFIVSIEKRWTIEEALAHKWILKED